jgi:hypothetical protein
MFAVSRALLVLSATSLACGGLTNASAVNDPCTSSDTCQSGLSCVSNRCEPTADASFPDASNPKPDSSVVCSDPKDTVCDGLCVDTTIDKANCGGCGFACTGDCSQSRCLSTLYDPNGQTNEAAGQIARDLTDRLYFNTFASGISWLSLADGTRHFIQGIVGNQSSLDWMSISGGYVYYANSVIACRQPIAGGDEEVITVDSTQQTALDDHFLYRSDGSRMTRVPLDGGASSDLDPNSADGGFYALVALFSDGSHAYRYSDGFDTRLVRYDVDGSGHVIFPTNQKLYAGKNLMAASNGFVYWAALGTVGKVAIGGGSSTTFAAPPLQGVQRIAVDSTHLYVATQSNGLFRVSLLDGALEHLLATGMDNTVALVVDATSVYWSVNGKIMRLSPK